MLFNLLFLLNLSEKTIQGVDEEEDLVERESILEGLAIGYKKVGVEKKVVWEQGSIELRAENKNRTCLSCLWL